MSRLFTDGELEQLMAKDKLIEDMKFQLALGLTTVDNLMVSIEDLLPENKLDEGKVPDSYRNAVYWNGDTDTLIKTRG